MKISSKKISFWILTLAMLNCTQLMAQLSPLSTMYFQNQYVNNPAYAGIEQGLRLDVGVRLQDNKLPGAPKTQFITGTYALNSKTGLGINLVAEQVGLIKKVRTVASYAYHLPLNAEDDKVSFGLSLGFADQLVDYSTLSGQVNDISVNNFNQRQTYIDGDFGVLYRHKRFNLEAALPNISNFFREKETTNSVANLARYYMAASYQFYLSDVNGTLLEPKVAYRAIEGFKDILDIGANIRFVDQRLNIFGLYHSSQSATFGIGSRLMDNLSMNFMYTSATAVLAGESSGSYEVSLKLNLSKQKK